MIKIEPKSLMITTLFCLCQHFSLMTLIFIQHFGSIYWTVYCLRINYHSFESYWVGCSKYQTNMASLPFIFYLHKHIFLMIVQIFTAKHSSSNMNHWSLEDGRPLNFQLFEKSPYDHTLVTKEYTKNIK